MIDDVLELVGEALSKRKPGGLSPKEKQRLVGRIVFSWALWLTSAVIFAIGLNHDEFIPAMNYVFGGMAVILLSWPIRSVDRPSLQKSEIWKHLYKFTYWLPGVIAAWVVAFYDLPTSFWGWVVLLAFGYGPLFLIQLREDFILIRAVRLNRDKRGPNN